MDIGSLKSVGNSISEIGNLAKKAGGKLLLGPLNSFLGKSLNLDKVAGGLFDSLTSPNTWDSLLNNWSQAHMTGAQKEQNEWTAMREDSYWQRNVEGMQEAGLNPALLYGGSASGPTPSASAAPASGMSLSDMLELAAIPQKIESMELQNQLLRKDIAWYDTEHESKVGLIDAQAKVQALTAEEIPQKIEESKSRVANNEADTALKQLGLSKMDAEIALDWAEYASRTIDNNFKEQINPLLLRAQELENEFNQTRNDYQVKRILAELAETNAHITVMYAEAALSGSRKAGVDLNNEYLQKQKPFFASMAKSEANFMKWRSESVGYQSLSAKYGVNVSKYYSEHYEEAFRNQWSKSGSTFGYTEMIGKGIGAAVSAGLMMAAF